MPLIDIGDLKVKEPRPGWKGRFFHSENMTLAYYTVTAGASIHEHSHPNDEVWNFVEGRFEVTIDGRTQIAEAGSAAVVPPDVRHAVTALTDGRAIVVDHPRRDTVGGISLA